MTACDEARNSSAAQRLWDKEIELELIWAAREAEEESE